MNKRLQILINRRTYGLIIGAMAVVTAYTSAIILTALWHNIC